MEITNSRTPPAIMKSATVIPSRLSTPLPMARKAMLARARWLLNRAALKKHYREIKIKDDRLLEDSLMDSLVEAGGKLKQTVPE